MLPRWGHKSKLLSSIPKKHLWNNNILPGPKFPVVALKKSNYIHNSLTKENKAHRTLPRLFWCILTLKSPTSTKQPAPAILVMKPKLISCVFLTICSFHWTRILTYQLHTHTRPQARANLFFRQTRIFGFLRQTSCKFKNGRWGGGFLLRAGAWAVWGLFMRTLRPPYILLDQAADFSLAPFDLCLLEDYWLGRGAYWFSISPHFK